MLHQYEKIRTLSKQEKQLHWYLPWSQFLWFYIKPSCSQVFSNSQTFSDQIKKKNNYVDKLLHFRRALIFVFETMRESGKARR